MNFGETATGSEPSVEAIGEYKISLATPPAEYGRTSGATMNYTTKSGTNEFHGSAWDYHNNSKLRARRWQAAGRGNSRSNEYGVAGGGPVRIPGYNGRNRTFFFSTLNFYRQSASGSASSLVTTPTAAMRQGDFSDPSLNTLYDITDRFTDQEGQVRRRPFPNNQIPVSRMSNVSGFFMNLFPLPNTGGGATELNYVGASTGSFTPWDITAKIDHNITDNHRLSGFYQFGTQPRSSTSAIFGADFGSTDFDEIHRTRLDYNWVISPTVVNTFLFGVNRNTFGSQRANFGQNIGQQAGLSGFPDPNCPAVSINPAGSGSLSFCSGEPADTNANTITTWSNTTLLNKGAHTIKFGFQSVIYHVNHVTLGGAAGGNFASAAGSIGFGFQGAAEYTTDTNGQGGFPMADFFLGLPSQVATVSTTDLREREAYHGFFVQDDWKVTPKLTLNLGLRWDINVPFSTVESQYTGLDVNLANTAAGGRLGTLEFYGDGPGRNGKSRPGRINYNDFGPRIGLAYQINDKTVLRAGAGILQTAIQSFNARFINRTGFAASGTPRPNPDPFGIFFEWDNPFPADVLGTIPNTDPTFRNNQNFLNWMREEDIGKSPEIYNLSFGLQHQLADSILVEATYFGNLLRHASDHGPINSLYPQFRSLGPLLDMNINDPAVLAAGFGKPYIRSSRMTYPCRGHCGRSRSTTPSITTPRS